MSEHTRGYVLQLATVTLAKYRYHLLDDERAASFLTSEERVWYFELCDFEDEVKRQRPARAAELRCDRFDRLRSGD